MSPIEELLVSRHLQCAGDTAHRYGHHRVTRVSGKERRRGSEVSADVQIAAVIDKGDQLAADVPEIETQPAGFLKLTFGVVSGVLELRAFAAAGQFEDRF